MYKQELKSTLSVTYLEVKCKMKHLRKNVLTDGILTALSSILRHRGIEIRSAARQGKGKKQQEQVGSNIHQVKREIYKSFHLHEFDSRISPLYAVLIFGP